MNAFQTYLLPDREVRVYSDDTLEDLLLSGLISNPVIVTDDNICLHHQARFYGYPLISLPPGEQNKNLQTLESLLSSLLSMEAGRDATIVAIGGGVLCDMAGFAASIYKRGIRLVLVPTTILAMADAAVGGKNGVNAGLLKNMIGTVYQPDIILYDYSFLRSLPPAEWVNGFAEVIKHACIGDETMFRMLEKLSLHDYQADLGLTAELMARNLVVKMSIVTKDTSERGIRKWLNFGHTIGHAIENLHGIPHGHAVSIGMAAACNLSERVGLLHFEDAARVIRLLSRYHLPVDIETLYEKVENLIRQDKKRKSDRIEYIVMKKISQVDIQDMSLDEFFSHLPHIL